MPNTRGENDFPPILSAAQMLPPAGHLELSRSDLIATYSAGSSGWASFEEAFQLVLVLHLLVSNHQRSRYSPSSKSHSAVHVWHDLQQRLQHQTNLELLASELLESIAHAAEHEDDCDVEDILCTSFHFDSSHSRTIRAIDLLPHPGVPSNILRHPLVTIAISELWKYGKARSRHGGRNVPQKLLAVYDSTSAPRIQHALHFAFHLVYVFLLAHLILYPSPLPVVLQTPGGPMGVREPLITMYSIANISSRPFLSLVSLPHFLVIVSFLFSLPASPSPGTAPYASLLCAFCCHMIILHFPITTSPLFVLEPAHVLPLSSLYYTFFVRRLLPVFAFFLPMILTSAALLSISLSEAMGFAEVLAAPSAARLTFLGLLTITVFLMIFFLIFVFVHPSIVDGANTPHKFWEWYGADAGLSGRRALIRAINLYSASPSGSVAFPPPLNLLLAPLVLLRLSQRTKFAVWRITVGPLAFFIAAFWCWGLL